MLGKCFDFHWEIPTWPRRSRATQGGWRPLSENTGAKPCGLVGAKGPARVSGPSDHHSHRQDNQRK